MSFGAARARTLAAVVPFLIAAAAPLLFLPVAAAGPQGQAAAPDVVGTWLADCAICHGADAKGTNRGPSLVGVGRASVDYELTTGRMPITNPAVELGNPNLQTICIDLAYRLPDGGHPIFTSGDDARGSLPRIIARSFEEWFLELLRQGGREYWFDPGFADYGAPWALHRRHTPGPTLSDQLRTFAERVLPLLHAGADERAIASHLGLTWTDVELILRHLQHVEPAAAPEGAVGPEGGTAFQALGVHGQDARATGGTAFQAVGDHGQDARATENGASHDRRVDP